VPGASAGVEGEGVDALDASRGPRSIAEILRLLGEGVPVAILLALGKGPLRTKELTAGISGYTPRTLYRHIPHLVELELIEREQGARSAVFHRLTEERGKELWALIERFSAAAKARRQSGLQGWAALRVLADLWEAGAIAELSRGPQSPTGLAREVSDLSYHQLSRRAGMIKTAGLLEQVDRAAGQRRCYALTVKARRTMGLVAGIAGWLERHEETLPGAGLALDEIVTLLRAALPLVELPAHSGKCLTLHVTAADEMDQVCAVIGPEGWAEATPPAAAADGWAEGDARTWCTAMVSGRFDGFRGDDEELVLDFLAALHTALWT
jgi:DNA-binding HxlR family transcriptional regulator